MNTYFRTRASFRKGVVALFLLWPALAFAQDEKELAPVSRTYALTNATIVQSPGRTLEHGNVIIKDGLIIAVGKGASVPAGATIVKGDSMFVYAGFIDGLSHTGVTKPKEDANRERSRDPGNPSPDQAGITPQTDVRVYLNPSDKSVEDLRSIGFTTAQVVPYGVFLPGEGAIIQLGGGSAVKMVLQPASAFYAELTPAQSVFPSTVIGVISKFHELYFQASNTLSYESVYASNRSGLERPSSDKVLQAFYPMIEKKKPVVFRAEKMLDVYRVLALQADLGFNLTVANIREGWTLADKLKASGANVFVSLDLPEEKKDDDKKGDKKADDKKEKKGDDKKTEAPKPEEKKPDAKPEPVKEKTANEKEKEILEARRAEFITKYAGVAAVYQKAGITFGFSTLGAKTKDIAANLRRIIAAGLTEDQALAALTTSPAKLLGLSDRLGSVDNGKIANLVITDKPYFNEKAKVRYVFVDGEMFKQDVKDKKDADKKGKKDAKIDLAGTWTFSTDTPDGKHENKFTFVKNGDSYSGTATGDRIGKNEDLKSLDFSGDHIKFSYTLSIEGNTIEVTVEGTFDDNAFKGTSSTPAFGSFSTNGVKDPGL